MNPRQRVEYKGIVRTPQFPGQQKGLSIDAVRTFIKKQKRCKGFRFALTTSEQSFDISVSGSARLFLGFVFSFSPDTLADFPPFVNMTINNEVIIQDVNPNFFTARYMDDEYYFFPRPLSGSDDMKLTVQPSAAPINLDVGIYYI